MCDNSIGENVCEITDAPTCSAGSGNNIVYNSSLCHPFHECLTFQEATRSHMSSFTDGTSNGSQRGKNPEGFPFCRARKEGCALIEAIQPFNGARKRVDDTWRPDWKDSLLRTRKRAE